MKKFFIIALMAFVGMSAYAQSEKGDMAAGVNVSYGTMEGYNNLGIGGKFQYNLTDAIRIEPSANYFLKKDYVSMWDVNVNVQYLFNVAEKLTIYPLAGATMVGMKWEGGEGDSEIGLNVGAGVEYKLTEKLGLNFDYKYQMVSELDRSVLSLGVVFKF